MSSKPKVFSRSEHMQVLRAELKDLNSESAALSQRLGGDDTMAVWSQYQQVLQRIHLKTAILDNLSNCLPSHGYGDTDEFSSTTSDNFSGGYHKTSQH